jgi:hypothetical protein
MSDLSRWGVVNTHGVLTHDKSVTEWAIPEHHMSNERDHPADAKYVRKLGQNSYTDGVISARGLRLQWCESRQGLVAADPPESTDDQAEDRDCSAVRIRVRCSEGGDKKAAGDEEDLGHFDEIGIW